MKKHLPKILCLILVFFTMSIFVTSANAFENNLKNPVAENVLHSGTSGDTTWRLENGTLYIEGIGEMANYANIGDIPPWREFYREITAIVIGDEVTYIGNRAFKGLNKVTTATIGSAVATIGYECFYGCTSLVNVDIKATNLTSIGSLCFYNCAFDSFEIPATVTNLANRAFKLCKNLTSVVIPDAVTTTGYEVFMGCAALETVQVSTGLNMINPLVFQDCVSLKEVFVPKNIIRVRNSAFSGCTALEVVDFEDDDKLYASTSGDPAIATNAFANCANLTLKGWMHGTLNDYAVRKNIPFKANNSSIFIYRLDANNNAIITGIRGKSTLAKIPSIIDGNTVVTIGSSAFRNNAYIKSVTIPETVTSIEGRAFQDCSALETVSGLENVTTIAYSAFQNCSSLTCVNFSANLTAINANSFNGCVALGEVYVPNTVATVNSTAFTGCSNAVIKTQAGSAAARYAANNNITVKIVTDFDYDINADGKSVTVTGALSNSTVFDIPETIDGYTVTSIGKSAFRNATHITDITLPYTLTEISGRAFQNTGLTSIVIPQSVTIIDYSAFEDCANLTEVVFWETPSTIHTKAFDDCTDLTFYGTEGSVVEAFANSKGFTFAKGRKYATYELPVININTNGQSITSKEDYVDMTFSLENCDDELINVTGGIRLRGNSTMKFPKKPYRIKFDKKQSLFGLEKAKSWVLLAEWVDPSNLHNYTAYNLGAQMPGLTFTPSAHKVNVYLNGEFQGLYTLCEQIQENSGRVGNELDEITESMVDLKDYNFLICMDYNVTEDPTAVLDETYYYIPEHDRYFELKYPEKDQFTSEEQFASFLTQLKQYTKDIMDAFANRDAETIKANVNVESLVDFLIIDQIMGEVDHGSKSFYMYYTGTSSDPAENNKLNFGPIWDYDFSLYTQWTSEPNMQYVVSNKVIYSNVFYKGLIDIPEFYAMVIERYELYALPALTEYIANFDNVASGLEESIELNNALWYEDKYGSDISKNNVDFLKNFLINRVKVLDEVWLGNKE